MLSVLGLLFLVANTAILSDKMNIVPGYPSDFGGTVYAGYLNTSSPTRSLYYIFIEASPNNSLPLTLWLNGGPGCSSLIGFLSEIGPYYLEQGQAYTPNITLTKNPYTWLRASNLLFLQSPAGVGYSTNTDSKFMYNDATTAQDNLDALLQFFKGFSEYGVRPFWIAGESYAGKYIPDLAVKIIQNNYKPDGFKFNFQGMLIGNGVMGSMSDLFSSTVQFMYSHDFVDPQIMYYFRSSCQIDPLSAGCRYFISKFIQTTKEVNPFNIYGYCYYNDTATVNEEGEGMINSNSQQSVLRKLVLGSTNSKSCMYTRGMFDYFNTNSKAFRATGWNGPCADNITAIYHIEERGSVEEYRYILAQVRNYTLVLYNGNADSVVPFLDTLKNIDKLNMPPPSLNKPFFVDAQHAGWNQTYSELQLIIVKGGSHMVSSNKRNVAYTIFSQTIAK